jgi:hypothetical protein
MTEDTVTLINWATFFEEIDTEKQLSPEVVEYLRDSDDNSPARQLDDQRLEWLRKQVGM